MYNFYAIRSLKNGDLYKGISVDVVERLKQHNSGRTRSTKSNRPWELVYIEECENREEARRLEKYYKTGFGREKLNILVKDK